MSGDKVITFKIWAQNMVRRGVAAAARELEGLKRISGSVASAGRAMGAAFGWVRDQFVKVAGAVAIAAAILAYSIQRAFRFEALTIQFKVLFGSLNKAKQHMAELAQFAAVTPFELPQLVEASRTLHVFTQGVMGGVASLRMIGDAAAATGADLSEVAMWVGRAYAMIKAGKPFGEAAMRLSEMGILTAEGRMKMEKLQASGAQAADIFAVLTAELARFAGGMDELSRTGEGKLSTLKDSVNAVAVAFGQAFAEDAKDAIQSLIDWLDRLVANGTVEAWAQKVSEVLATAVEVGKALAGGGENRAKALEAIGNLLIGALKMGAGAAAEILMKAAPVIGTLMGRALSAAANAMNVRRKVIDDLRSEGKISRSPFGVGWTDEENKLIDEETKRRLAEQGDADAAQAIADSTLNDSGRDQIKDALDSLKEIAKQVADEELPKPEGGGGGGGGGDGGDVLGKMRSDEQKAVEATKKEIEDLVKNDENAAKAYLEAVEEAKAAGKDMASIATWAKILEDTKEKTPEIKKKAAEDAKQKAEELAKRDERLQERRDALRIGMMSEKDQKAEREKRVKDLEKKVADEKDPGKKMDLKEKLQDELEALASLAGKKKDRQSIGMGDVFEKIYGQSPSDRDPAFKTAENTAQILETLKRMEGKGGLSG